MFLEYFQSYHDEMLLKSPRKKLFHDYAKQLVKRYPTMKEEIQARQLRVNTQWQEVESVISPQEKYRDKAAMITGEILYDHR